VEKEKKTKNENGCAQKYRYTVRAVRVISPTEEEGHGGKDLWKGEVLSLE